MPNLVAKQVLENQTIQMGKMLALYNSSSTYRWNKKKEYERVTWYTYDSFAARVAAPIWRITPCQAHVTGVSLG